MAKVDHICENEFCGKVFITDTRNLKRGWGKCCSKSCASKKRESLKNKK